MRGSALGECFGAFRGISSGRVHPDDGSTRSDIFGVALDFVLDADFGFAVIVDVILALSAALNPTAFKR